VAEITLRRVLNTYEDDISAYSYEYKDERQQFYFYAQFTNETPPVVENGVRLKPPTYDVLISLLGKRQIGGTVVGPVADMEVVKNNIVEYFKSHMLQVAEQPPERVIFE
jgi:hypothetical protein